MKDLKEEWESLQDGSTRAQRSAKNVGHAKYLLYKVHGHCANKHLHSKTSDDALCIQCKPPEYFEATDFTILKCASGKCQLCGLYARPTAEITASKRIKFYCNKKLPTCTKCGTPLPGTKCCKYYVAKKNPKKRGQLKTKHI